MLSKDELARLRSLLDSATPGPWTTGEGDPRAILSTVGWECVAEANGALMNASDNAALIVEAMSKLPTLLRIAEAVAELAAAERECEALRMMQWHEGGIAKLRAAEERRSVAWARLVRIDLGRSGEGE